MFRWFLTFILLAGSLQAQTQAQTQERRPSYCIAIAQALPGASYLQLAGFNDPVPGDSVRITYVDHSMFLIQTPGGISVATDYNGYLGAAGFLPDVATMNNAHSSHFTPSPSPGIPFVLEGWAKGGQPRGYNLDLGEMLIRNVHTDIRSNGGGRVVENGNSIFIFEVAGMCIGHLGHLHHEPDIAQYAAIGRLDVVMAAVDGGLTLDRATMTRVLNRLKSRVVIPMHWFGRSTLERFLEGMAPTFAIDRSGGNAITLSLETLPRQPSVVVLSPALLRDTAD